jgi:hypothetical protein
VENKVFLRSHSRREALKILGVGIATAGSLLAVQGCESKPEPKKKTLGAEPATPTSTACGDTTPLDEAAKSMRQTLQYREQSADAAKNCSGCALYVAPAAGGKCGGCKLFAGGVNPAGYCLSYAPAAPGAASGKPG